MSAYTRGKQTVTLRDVKRAYRDTESRMKHSRLAVTLGLLLAALSIGFLLFGRI